MKKIIIPGGSGFLGQYLATYFHELGYEIFILSRKWKPSKGHIHYAVWDGKTLEEAWTSTFEGAEVVINLAGRSVDCRYTIANKKEILESRTFSTKAIGDAILNCKIPPKIWLNASTATIYRYSEDKEMTEATGEIGAGFSVNVAKAWEAMFHSIVTPNTRKVTMRVSIVLGKGGGAMSPILSLTRLGLGGKQGHGNQYISWIHLEDFARAVNWFLHNNKATGIYNVVSPKPILNKNFMTVLRKVIKMPFGLPATKWMIKIGAFFINTEAELVLKSRQVVPERLLKEGFTFKYTDLKTTFESIV